jgi:hypothetical protein
LFYDCLKLFIPFNLKYRAIKLNEYFLPFSIYNPYYFYLGKYDRFSLDSIKFFFTFIDSYNLIEKTYCSIVANNSNKIFKKVFPVKLNNYFTYMNEVVNSSDQAFGFNIKFITDKLLLYSNKLVRVRSTDNIKSFLYGFKFHFVGRFTRKQQSASM